MQPGVVMGGVAWAGAAVFAASLVYFGYFYLVVLAGPASPAEGVAVAAAVDVLLFSMFALHHSVCARSGAKAVIQRHVPARFERTVYVWIASVLFLAVCLLWRPLPGTAWQAPGWTRWLLQALQLSGLVLTLRSAVRLDIAELAGLRDSPTRSPSAAAAAEALEVSGPYRWVRHPIYLGWLLLVWPMHTMTVSQLLFAAVSTTYLVVAIPLEERSLTAHFGESYTAYQRRVRSRLIPGVW